MLLLARPMGPVLFLRWPSLGDAGPGGSASMAGDGATPGRNAAGRVNSGSHLCFNADFLSNLKAEQK